MTDKEFNDNMSISVPSTENELSHLQEEFGASYPVYMKNFYTFPQVLGLTLEMQ